MAGGTTAGNTIFATLGIVESPWSVFAFKSCEVRDWPSWGCPPKAVGPCGKGVLAVAGHPYPPHNLEEWDYAAVFAVAFRFLGEGGTCGVGDPLVSLLHRLHDTCSTYEEVGVVGAK